jgi:hypothetical protein
VTGVPAGSAKVTVSSPKPGESRSRDGGGRGGGGGRDGRGGGNVPAEQPPPADPAEAELAKKWFPIPETYSDPGKSGLQVTVSGKVTTFDIDLK